MAFVVLERQEAVGLRARVKAGMIEHRTVGLLEEYGLAERILVRGSRIGMCEFRADGEAFVLDYAALCGGSGHYIYPQHELVGDWAEQLVAAGGDVRFGVTVTGVEQTDDGAQVRAVDASGGAFSLECEVVVCCDGASSVLSAGMSDVSVAYPFRWLTLIAQAPRAVFTGAGGTHDDWDEYDRVMAAERRTAILVTPDRASHA
jgi:p-hydroxybenzoate 3-monooxygenase